MTTDFWQARANAFQGTNILILGGLGFLGSSLAIRLVGMGARVLLADAFWLRNAFNCFGMPAREKGQGHYVGQPGQYNALFSRLSTMTAQSFPHRMGREYILETLANPRMA